MQKQKTCSLVQEVSKCSSITPNLPSCDWVTIIPNAIAITREDFMVNAVQVQAKAVKICENTKLFRGIYDIFNALARNKVSTGTWERQHKQKQSAWSWHVPNNSTLHCNVTGKLITAVTAIFQIFVTYHWQRKREKLAFVLNGKRTT